MASVFAAILKDGQSYSALSSQLATQVLTPARLRSQPGLAFTPWPTLSTFSPALFPAPGNSLDPFSPCRLLSSFFRGIVSVSCQKHVPLFIFNTLISTCLEQREVVSTVFNQKPSDFSTCDPVNDMWFHKQIWRNAQAHSCMFFLDLNYNYSRQTCLDLW